MDTALLILRLVLGTAMAAHGAQKLFGWFGGYGLKGTGDFFESLGFRPGVRFARAAGTAEVLGGSLLALGLLGPVGPALILSVMLVAMATVHRGHGFFAATNGVEVPVLYLVGSLAVALGGAGAWSLDALLGLEEWFTPAVTWAALGAGALGAMANLALRQRPEPVVQQ